MKHDKSVIFSIWWWCYPTRPLSRQLKSTRGPSFSENYLTISTNYHSKRVGTVLSSRWSGWTMVAEKAGFLW